VAATAWRGAFSTLGCSELPLTDVVQLARDGGWNGLELRAAPDEPVHVGLAEPERKGVRRVLADAGVTPLAIASYVDVDDAEATDGDVITAVLAHVELADDIGASFVRVFPGGPSGDGAAVRRLSAIARHLDHYPGVAVAIETHDSCARGEDVARVLARVDHPQIRAIWDVQHPWRAGERVADTLRALAPFIAYVQITDARSMDDLTPCLLGTGVLPLRDAYDALQSAGYDGWVSLEWASYWYPAAPPLADALGGAQHWLRGSLWESD
jgi:sugar phosphate isomerase/epimerase